MPAARFHGELCSSLSPAVSLCGAEGNWEEKRLLWVWQGFPVIELSSYPRAEGWVSHGDGVSLQLCSQMQARGLQISLQRFTSLFLLLGALGNLFLLLYFSSKGKLALMSPNWGVILDHVVISAGGFAQMVPPSCTHCSPRAPQTAMAWSVLPSHQLELPCPHTVLLMLAGLQLCRIRAACSRQDACSCCSRGIRYL